MESEIHKNHDVHGFVAKNHSLDKGFRKNLVTGITALGIGIIQETGIRYFNHCTYNGFICKGCCDD